MAPTSEWGLFEWGEAEWGSGEDDAVVVIDLALDCLIPVESTGFFAIQPLDTPIPVDSTGVKPLSIDMLIPIDSVGLETLNRLDAIPIDALLGGIPLTQYAAIPIDSTGLDPNKLLLIWSVRQPLDTPFSIRWRVVQRGLIAKLQLRWTIRQHIMPFTLRWNVVPDILSPLISIDVQKPFGSITKTP